MTLLFRVRFKTAHEYRVSKLCTSARVHELGHTGPGPLSPVNNATLLRTTSRFFQQPRYNVPRGIGPEQARVAGSVVRCLSTSVVGEL